jgi:pimeloyl-ACP methyl ester carboxylesterase
LAELADISIPDLTKHDTIAEMAETVLANAPEQFALAGLSLGGYLAFEIMRTAPHRVTKLALLDTSAGLDTEEQINGRKESIRLSMAGKYREVIAQRLPFLLHPDSLRDSQLTQKVIAMSDRVGPEVFCRRQKAMMNRKDSRGDLSRITCPTLVVCGRQDVIEPLELHEEVVSGIPGARLAIVEDCGHLSSMERPQAVTALLRYWLTYM